MRCLARIGVVIVMLIAPAAAGADPIAVGGGTRPAVAVDSSGTAYVAWDSLDGHSVYLCRLPVGATSCSRKTVYTSATETVSARPGLWVGGPTGFGISVTVLSNFCCTSGLSQTLLFNSNDSGGKFPPPKVVGNLNPTGDAVQGPGSGASVITSGQINSYYQLAPTDGSPEVTTTVPLSSTYVYHGVIAIDAGRPIVVFDDHSTLAWTTTDGSDPNQGPSWAAPQTIGAGHDPHLATGPGGLLLMSTNAQGNLELRRFTGSDWGNPEGVGVPGALASLAVGASGKRSVVFRTSSGGQTQVAFTGQIGGYWSYPVSLATDSAISDLRSADAPDGTGVAVWDNGTIVSFARHSLPVARAAPHAAFSVFPTGRLCPGNTVSFDARASSPGSSPIVRYIWGLSGPASLDPKYRGFENPVPYARIFETTGPSFTQTFRYTALLGPTPYTIHPAPVAFAILGARMYLTVVNAEGLQDSSPHQTLPFADAVIPVDDPFSRYPRSNCHNIGQVLVPPSFAKPAVHLVGTRITVPFRCTSSSDCGGLVKVATVIGPGGRTAQAGSAGKVPASVVVGKARFALSEGQHGTIRINLSRRGRALVAKHKLRKVRVTVISLRIGRGHPKTISRVLAVTR